jgi:hypothetical protein
VDDILAKKYNLATLPGSKLLVLGVGGGCDVISAYAVARLLPGDVGRDAVYGNTKKRDEKDFEAISPHIFRLPGPTVAVVPGQATHGSTAIDRSVPRGPGGCPFIVVLPDRVDEAAVAAEIRSLGVDAVLGVDTGGDSIVGSDDRGSGRDKRMLRVLRRTGLPLLLAVLAPGSDGEASFDKLHKGIRTRTEQGRYLGCFSLDAALPDLRTLSESLTEGRTPRIIVAAAEGRLPCDAAGPCAVPRGLRPVVPRDWLTHGFVFNLREPPGV